MNDIKLQSPNGTHPVDENLRPLFIGEKQSAIETAQHGDGARVNGDLLVTGSYIGSFGNIACNTLDTVGNITIGGDITSHNLSITDTGNIGIFCTAIGLNPSDDLLLNAGGDITLDAGGGEIYLKDDGSTFGGFGTGGAYSGLILYEDGGASTDDFFEIRTTTHGATEIRTYDDAAEAANITLNADGILVLNATTDIQAKKPIKIKEMASAVADSAAYGQIWVKDETPNELYFTTDAGDDIQLTDGTSAAGGGGSSVLTQVEVTISEAEMDALHTTEKELVAAQGANMVVIPVQIIAFVDRDGSTTQSGTGDLRIGCNGGTTLGSDVWYSFRRFMWNESGDRVLNISGFQGLEIGTGLGDFDNRSLTAKTSSAITSGSIDSVKMFVTYYVYDNS